MCLAIDALTVIAVGAALAALMWFSDARRLAVVSFVVAVGLVAATVATITGYVQVGRGIGGLALGQRSVDSQFFLPALPLFPKLPGRIRPVMVDIRRGADPLDPLLAPWADLGPVSSSPGGAAETTRNAPRRAGQIGMAVIMFDGGAMHWFAGTCVLGRHPMNSVGGAILPLPDMGRRLSASHAVLSDAASVSGHGVAWITDLGSSSGTWLDRAGRVVRLAPHTPLELTPADHVRLGDYWFRIGRSQA